MNNLKKLMPLLFTLMLVFILAACGSNLEKPSGLENNQKQSTMQVDNDADNLSKDEATENVKEKKNSKSKSDQKSAQKDKQKSDDQESSEKDSKIEKKSKGSKSASSEEKKTDANSAKPHSKSESKANHQTQDQATSSSQDKTLKGKTDSKTSSQKQEKSDKQSSQSKTESKTKPKPKPAPKPEPKPKPKKATVTQSIVISSSEVPLSNAKTEIKDGDTILDALIKVTKDKGIQMDYRGGQGSNAYVEGIANVYEFDRGQGSGWMIRINGVFPNRGVGTIPVYDGDNIEWLYTTDLGKDLGANLQPFR